MSRPTVTRVTFDLLTLGGRVFSRTIRRLEPSRRHDAGFLDKVKGLPWDAQDGIVRGRSRKEPAPPSPPTLVGENIHSHNPDLPGKTEATHSETPKESDDTDDADNVLMSETPLKFDGEASGMTPDPKRSKETAKQGETRESNALPGELPELAALQLSRWKN